MRSVSSQSRSWNTFDLRAVFGFGIIWFVISSYCGNIDSWERPRYYLPLHQQTPHRINSTVWNIRVWKHIMLQFLLVNRTIRTLYTVVMAIFFLLPKLCCRKQLHKLNKTSCVSYVHSSRPCAQGGDAPLAGFVDCCHNSRAGTGKAWSQHASAGAAAGPGHWSMWRCICGNEIPGPEGGVTIWSGWLPMEPRAPLMEEEERVVWINRLENKGGAQERGKDQWEVMIGRGDVGEQKRYQMTFVTHTSAHTQGKK